MACQTLFQSSAPAVTSLPTGYSTAFAGTEDPLSESGFWLPAPASWTAMRKTPGFCYSPNSSGYADGIAILDTTKVNTLPTQSITGIVANLGAGGAPEIELHLRSRFSGNNVFTYELDMSRNGVCSVQRWNGTFQTGVINIQTDVSRPGGGDWQNGDSIFFGIVGSTLTAKCNGTQLFSFTDVFADIGGPSDARALAFATGSCGIGVDAEDPTNGALFGWSSWSVVTS